MGWEDLTQLPAAPQSLFSLPVDTDDRAYREPFRATMVSAKGIAEQMIESMYRGERLWHATMGESMLGSLSASRPVVQIAGRFHVESDGGIVLQLLTREPKLKVLTIVPSGPSAGWRQTDLRVVAMRE